MRINGEGQWQPETEADIRACIDDADLQESHYLDMKREVGDNPRKRKETAADLASFALDGGALLIGVAENKENRTWELAPQPLNGLAERIEQVAASAVDPALFVATHEIPSAADPTTGYVFVQIPQSPSAPHMVDGVYIGRGDKTKTRLSDAEVTRYHAKREPIEGHLERLLDAERDRDHVPAHTQQTGHLYLVAHPLSARRDVALQLVRDDGSELLQLIVALEGTIPRDVREFAPTPGYATATATRAQGRAWCTQAALGPGRTFESTSAHNDEEDLLDIEFREDGGIRVLMGRMTATWGRYGGDAKTVVADGLAVAYALRVVRWADAIAERTGYHGSWGFGVLATGLRGLSSSAYQERFSSGPTYDADEYREVTTASGMEIHTRPQAVAGRLVGRLVRGLATSVRYDGLLRAD
ncbi:AlbA family DNA-binding domain-containing protein [Nocardioides mangrovi]|uniref:ATP-binding protein n=1 Tax=Nocardioides mangrovi TaxID=2874580 RepID=A0ABS7U7Q8_9ACTN|nr:ATP-binding protein [Nocardioides mangrovi]MBZ5736920.1 ATP-binding protein [Nocardioides mangrovi]